MTSSTPEIAVVIATRDRESRLAFALDALAAQTLDRNRFEVIVVRGTEPPATRADRPDGLDVRFLAEPGSTGAAAQRNRGWRATQAPLVAFTDDDCRPASDWLERLLAEDGGEETILQGRTEPDPAERHLLLGLARSVEVTGPGAWFETCNIAYPRSLLERLGGFDERFPGAWGEDTDLGLRAIELGARREYVDAARVWHAVLPRTLRDALRETARYEAIPLVLARHPQQREAIWAGLFLWPSHATVILAIAGAIAFRRRPLLAALTAVPYLEPLLDRSRIGPRGLARFAVFASGRFAVDALETAHTIRGAIRHRVIVA